MTTAIKKLRSVTAVFIVFAVVFCVTVAGIVTPTSTVVPGASREGESGGAGQILPAV